MKETGSLSICWKDMTRTMPPLLVSQFRLQTRVNLILPAQDTYVRNLFKCGLGLNDIGVNTVAFEYGPWSIEKASQPQAYRDAIDQIIGDKHIVCPGIETLQNSAHKKTTKSKAFGTGTRFVIFFVSLSKITLINYRL